MKPESTTIDPTLLPDLLALLKERAVGHAVMYSDRLLPLIPRIEAAITAPAAINTNLRLFDLVRQMRSELHQADLITDEEYAWLSGWAAMAHSPDGGSPSPRRLEDYDRVRDELVALKAKVASLFKDYLDIVEESDGGREFHPITISCCRAMKVEPLGKLLDELKEASK